MSGFSMKCLDQDADRISIQSSHGPTWVPERRKHRWMRAQAHDVGVSPDEVLIIKSRAVNRVEFRAHTGDILVRSTRRGAVYLPKDRDVLLTMKADETLIVRCVGASDPQRGHRVNPDIQP